MNATAGSERGLRGLKDTPNTELRGSQGATFSDSPAVYAVLDDSGVLQYVGCAISAIAALAATGPHSLTR